MPSDIERWKRILRILDYAILALCIAYGLLLLLIHLTFASRLVCFIDPLLIGLIFLLIGVYPFARRKSIERLEKRRRYF